MIKTSIKKKSNNEPNTDKAIHVILCLSLDF